jgi:hypothetical protein
MCEATLSYTCQHHRVPAYRLAAQVWPSLYEECVVAMTRPHMLLSDFYPGSISSPTCSVML